MIRETMLESLAAEIKERAKELRFDLCGIAPAAPSAFKAEFRAWLERGFHGEMGYMARDPERRTDPRAILPDARSIIVVAMNYYTESEADSARPDEAVFARYARNEDYHDVMTPRLRDLLAWIKERCPHVPESPRGKMQRREENGASPDMRACNDRQEVAAASQRSTPNAKSRTPALQSSTLKAQGSAAHPLDSPPTAGRVYVDTGPILEREAAQRAGIGWFGKNTLLINSRRGSWFLLGEIVTNLPLPPDSPAEGGCGTCTRCLDACPTGALVRPYELDARRCISYLTIELKGPIPPDLAPRIGNRIFGCDICQEVCPFNERRSAPTAEPAFQPRPATIRPKLAELEAMTEEDFREVFKKSPVKRAKGRGLKKTVAAVAGNGDRGRIPGAICLQARLD